MENNILMSFEEPTDLQLVQLMNEVATEARNKVAIEKIHLSEKIKHEINAIKAQMNADRK